MPSNLLVATNYTILNTSGGAGASTNAYIGGSGTPQNPHEWRISSAKPLFAHPTTMAYHRKVKGIDQLVIKTKVPYTVTNTTTSQEEPVGFCESTVTLNFSGSCPQATIDQCLAQTASQLFWNTVAANLFTPLASRQPG